jgi:hypothetical protein
MTNFLNFTFTTVPDRNLSNSSSSSESVASWPGHPPNSSGILTPAQPPPYQPPPEHPHLNGRDNYGVVSRTCFIEFYRVYFIFFLLDIEK